MIKKAKKYLRKNRWVAFYKVAKKRFAQVPGDNFPAFVLR